MNKKLISIILVNWNTRDLTLQCIRSIINNNPDSNYEIIVSDNASSDGSAEAILSQYPDVKVLRNSENYGFAKGNNIAISHANGDYICLVNTDVEVCSNCLGTLLNYISSDPEIGLIGPKVLNGDGSLQITARKDISILNTIARILWIDTLFPGITFHTHKKIECVDVIAGCFWMIRKSALNQTGLLDENFFFYGEDRDYCKRMRQNGWKVVYHPGAQIYHYGGSSSAKKDPYKYYLLLENAYFQYWKKYNHPHTFVLYLILRVIYHFFRIFSNFFFFLLTFGRKSETIVKILRSWYCVQMLIKDYRKKETILEPSL